MKLSQAYPNFYQALKYYLTYLEINYSIPSDDSKKLSFMVPLASHKFGFDYYELNPTRTGGAIFEIITTLGLKTIKKTSYTIVFEDLTFDEWIVIFRNISNQHLLSEEYQALKHGYTKTKVSCFGSLVVLIMLLGLIWK